MHWNLLGLGRAQDPNCAGINNQLFPPSSCLLLCQQPEIFMEGGEMQQTPFPKAFHRVPALTSCSHIPAPKSQGTVSPKPMPGPGSPHNLITAPQLPDKAAPAFLHPAHGMMMMMISSHRGFPGTVNPCF